MVSNLGSGGGGGGDYDYGNTKWMRNNGLDGEGSFNSWIFALSPSSSRRCKEMKTLHSHFYTENPGLLSFSFPLQRKANTPKSGHKWHFRLEITFCTT